MSRDRETAGRGGISRRGLIGSAGIGVAAAGAGVLAGRMSSPASAAAASAVVPFRAVNQAGIVTPAQDRLHFAVFDVHTRSRAELVDLLKTWTLMAERMTSGHEAAPNGAIGAGTYKPPTDTGEALDLSPSRLTLTIGFGPSLFTTADGVDRFGIASRKPKALTDLPKFTGDALDPARSGGEIAIQACADDPQVAVHAIRNLARVGFGAVSVRWSQLGFGRTSSTSTSQVTARNLLGFKDGTRNIKAEEHDTVDKFVWVDRGDDQAWMAGGSYLVTRRIRMLIEPWDRTTLHEQERVIGRTKGTGAPMGAKDEFDELDLQSAGPSGPLVDKNAHVRLASAEELGGIQILRRGYNFTDGSDGFGHLDAGLFFIAYCRNPLTQFVPMQENLARNDALNEYIKHVGSAVFAVPPGLGADDYWGSTLFAS
ncbi:iron uptake transporter deferrochelatase/peroxidase subunit [Nocardia sp. NPDC046473]|uniref:iron uptake transporter deferrochelatase/peroxidase subunit n=1 Tax=Nocardia sp. NPDC046473 TaxID=3155733 RepID=UPI0033C9FFDA